MTKIKLTWYDKWLRMIAKCCFDLGIKLNSKMLKRAHGKIMDRIVQRHNVPTSQNVWVLNDHIEF